MRDKIPITLQAIADQHGFPYIHHEGRLYFPSGAVFRQAGTGEWVEVEQKDTAHAIYQSQVTYHQRFAEQLESDLKHLEREVKGWSGMNPFVWDRLTYGPMPNGPHRAAERLAQFLSEQRAAIRDLEAIISNLPEVREQREFEAYMREVHAQQSLEDLQTQVEVVDIVRSTIGVK